MGRGLRGGGGGGGGGEGGWGGGGGVRGAGGGGGGGGGKGTVVLLRGTLPHPWAYGARDGEGGIFLRLVVCRGWGRKVPSSYPLASATYRVTFLRKLSCRVNCYVL